MPINIGGTHWVLFVVLVGAACIQCFDSLPPSGREQGVLEKVAQRIIKYLDFEIAVRNCQQERKPDLVVLSKATSWTFQIVARCIQQTDGSACGILTCLHADLLSQGMKPPFDFTVSTKEVEVHRAGLACDLLLHGVGINREECFMAFLLKTMATVNESVLLQASIKATLSQN
eukprot:TRINITY_DN5089_c0_g1_i1.p1 TRINITY_DN5089_c0_g1~~TRINITY_DN5089_c0_g1_i1.p1  ORF type:complete len:173 (-),score=20.36 TRINITY_DN5089_c0_g1_i1:995-1513(-)